MEVLWISGEKTQQRNPPEIAELLARQDGIRFLPGIVDFYQSRTNAKINIAIERLVLISVVILPLTLLAGIYGMNIIVNARTQAFELGAVLLSMAVVAAAMLVWSRRQGRW